MPKKQQQNQNNSSSNNPFTAEQMIEVQHLQEQINGMNALFWSNFVIFELIVKNILTATELLYKPEFERYIPMRSQIILLSISLGIPVMYLILKFTGTFEVAKKLEETASLANKLLNKLDPRSLTPKIIEKSDLNLNQEEVEKDIEKLRKILMSYAHQRKVGRYASGMLAAFGLLDILMNYFPSNYTYKEIVFYLPHLIKDGNPSVFYLELGIYLSQTIYNSYNQPSIENAKIHLQELRDIFVTRQWKLKTELFHHFSLKPGAGQISITLANANDDIQISSELFLRTVARYLLQMKVPMLFFSDQHIVVRDWKYSNFDMEKLKENFEEFIKRCAEIQHYKSAKNLQIKNVIKKCGLQNFLECNHIDTFESNGLPQVQFIIKKPNELSKDQENDILNFAVKVVELYGKENVVVSDNAITISGCQCVNTDRIEALNKTEIPSIDLNIAANDNYQSESFKPKTNKKLKEEKEQEKEPSLSKKYQMIRNNLLSQKKINADAIAKKLTTTAVEAANDAIYYPLNVPGRAEGTTYAKVNRAILEKSLEKKDKKNFVTNEVHLDHCIKKIENNHVVVTNEIFTKELPNNNNNAPSKWLAQSFFKVKNENVSLYATSSEKIKLEEQDVEIECYDFDYLKLE